MPYGKQGFFRSALQTGKSPAGEMRVGGGVHWGEAPHPAPHSHLSLPDAARQLCCRAASGIPFLLLGLSEH